MSISGTVAVLADALRAYLAGKNGAPDVVELLAHVAEMPAYVRDQRLDLWEKKVLGYDRDRLATDRSYRAAIHVIALGRMNMYGAIEVDKTEQAYADVVTELRELGVTGLSALGPVTLDEW